MSEPFTTTRRSFAACLSATVFALPALAGQKATGNSRAEAAPGTEPPVGPAPAVTLIAEPGKRRLKRDAAADASVLTYNATLPGPLLRVRKGAPVSVRLINRLDRPTGLHWYGVRGPNATDGAIGLTQPPVPPGGTFDYVFPARDSGHFWYHPLLPGGSAEQVDRGLAGMLVVEEKDPPAIDQEHAVIIDDVRLDPDGEMTPDFLSLSDVARAGRLGNLLTMGAAPAPALITAPPGTRLRLRLLNTANARVCPLKFDRLSARVVGIDGQACDPFDPLRRTVIMAPGSRFDIIADMPAEGRDAVISADLGLVLPLVRLRGEGEPVAPRPKVTAIQGNDLPPAILLQNAQRASLVISGGLPRVGADADPTPLELKARFPDPGKVWLLNAGSLGGFSGKPLLSVKRGLPVVLALTNKSAWAQVLHVHGHNFRLLHPFDDGWEPYFLDTLYLAEGQTSHISFIADNPGRWAIRSSILEHFEGGVATWFEVV